jgi:hypothetical protein
MVLKDAQENKEHLKILMGYIDYYTDPRVVIKSIPDGATLGEVRDGLIDAFQQIKLRFGILENAKL